MSKVYDGPISVIHIYAYNSDGPGVRQMASGSGTMVSGNPAPVLALPGQMLSLHRLVRIGMLRVDADLLVVQ